MRTRRTWLIAGALAVALVVIGGTGVALAWAHSGGASWSRSSTSSGQYGSGPMMGSYGHGSMMGSYGNGSMMGPNGYGPMMGGGYGTAPVVGVTQVRIMGYTFMPRNIQVTAGTTVTWTNLDTAPHSVVFNNGMKDSGELQRGQTFSYTFTAPGTYTYYCDVHPYMTAQVVVTP